MRRGVSPKPPVPFVVIFTDLDGSLLDQRTYKWEEAKPALNRCKRLQVPLILVSSKTRAEIDVLRQELGLTSPFISENGGGIFFPEEGAHPVPPDTVLEHGLWKWSLGLPYHSLVQALREIRDELGWKIRGFSDMSLEEISGLTGLNLESTRLASLREYDEPFVLVEEGEKDPDVLYDAAKQRGLSVTSGGRFYHLHGKNDKGASVDKLVVWYGEHHSHIMSVALGDSPNDFSMLKRVSHPVLIRSSRQFSELQAMIPALRVTKEKGPKGWNAAVSEVLRKHIPGSH
ncbi:MAG: HAD-IIB family hydrolase [Desulfobacteraceae bacterium]|jgi:mannosyl-3-phosphoglycerate phosphatase